MLEGEGSQITTFFTIRLPEFKIDSANLTICMKIEIRLDKLLC